MDLNFFNLLQSVAAAERDLESTKTFSTYKSTLIYDVATLDLKHPHNVITVVPPFGKAPPRVPDETRVTRLSDAVRAAVRRAWNGGTHGRVGCSIVVHEGVYIDALGRIEGFDDDDVSGGGGNDEGESGNDHIDDDGGHDDGSNDNGGGHDGSNDNGGNDDYGGGGSSGGEGGNDVDGDDEDGGGDDGDDDDFFREAFAVPKGFSLEIVGLKNVRLVTEKIKIVGVRKADLTLKNIQIFDRKLEDYKGVNDAIKIGDGAHVELNQIRIHGPRSLAIHLWKSSLTLASAVVQSYGAISSVKSNLRVIDCDISSSITHAGPIRLEETVFEAKDTAFTCTVGNPSCVHITKTRANFEDCSFDVFGFGSVQPGDSPDADTKGIAGFEICAGSSVFLKNTGFGNFKVALCSTGSDCKIIADNCFIYNNNIAFYLETNSHGLIKNCLLHCAYVVATDKNRKGQIKLQNNQMYAGCIPTFLKDSQSVIPQHDFKNAVTEILKESLTRPEKPSRAQQSADTKRVHEEVLAVAARGDLFDYSHMDLFATIKRCSRCRIPQTSGAEKMKYCVGCKKICYCSKKCQTADWQDHKLVCQPGRRAP